MMNVRPQMTSVEERISRPAWRSASPKKRNTLRPKTSPSTRPQKRTISPNDSTQSRGTASQPTVTSAGHPAPRPDPAARPPASRERSLRSLDVDDVGVRGQQRLREHVVEREHAERGDDHGLVDRAPHARRATGRGHALVAADDGDDRAEQRAL